MRRSVPAFNIPPPVTLLIALLVAIHILRSFLGRQATFEFLYRFAFVPARLGHGEAYPGGSGAEIWTFLTYAFLHGDFVHLIVNILWMASFGSALAIRFGPARFYALFVLGCIAGALAHYLVLPGDMAPLVGASAGVSAMMAAALRFSFVPGGPLAGGRGRREAYDVPAPPLAVSLGNRRVLTFVILWFVLNLAFGVGNFGIAGEGSSIAWQAHIGGFLVGLLLFPLLDPVRADEPEFPG